MKTTPDQLQPHAWRPVKPDGYEQWIAMKDDSQLGYGWQSYRDCEVVCDLLNERDAERRKVRRMEGALLKIVETRWGYDGDCGVVGIANEALQEDPK